MRKTLVAATVVVNLTSILVSTSVQAQSNPGGYSGSLNSPPRVYVTPAYAPPPAPAYRPFFYTPPGYQGGGYYDYRRYGAPNSRDALNTCAYC